MILTILESWLWFEIKLMRLEPPRRLQNLPFPPDMFCNLIIETTENKFDSLSFLRMRLEFFLNPIFPD